MHRTTSSVTSETHRDGRGPCISGETSRSVLECLSHTCRGLEWTAAEPGLVTYAWLSLQDMKKIPGLLAGDNREEERGNACCARHCDGFNCASNPLLVFLAEGGGTTLCGTDLDFNYFFFMFLRKRGGFIWQSRHHCVNTAECTSICARLLTPAITLHTVNRLRGQIPLWYLHSKAADAGGLRRAGRREDTS